RHTRSDRDWSSDVCSSDLLMDEPLGALDRKLRDRMQLEIKQLHKRLGITVLYVTHDQEEALAMSDRICLMKAGRIEQIGSPEERSEERRVGKECGCGVWTC